MRTWKPGWLPPTIGPAEARLEAEARRHAGSPRHRSIVAGVFPLFPLFPLFLPFPPTAALIAAGIIDFARSRPLALPGVVVACVLAVLVGPRVGRRLGATPLAGIALVASVGAVLALTLTPGRLEVPIDPGCEALADVPRLRQLFSITNEHGLNVLMLVPLGITIAAGFRGTPRLALLAAGAALPFAIEAIQYALPELQRVCTRWDVIENVVGLTIGAILGLVGAAVLAARRRGAAGPVPPA